jgi:hypothetical protein
MKNSYNLGKSLAETFESSLFPLSTPPTGGSLHCSDIITILPSRDQARALFEFYAAHVNWLHHIIHVPSVRKLLDETYSTLNKQQLPPYNHIALLATIFSLSAYFSRRSLGETLGKNELQSCFRKWSFLAQRCLSAANYICNPSIEALQALLMVSSLLGKTYFGTVLIAYLAIPSAT